MILRGGSLPEFSKKHPVWTCRVLSRAKAIVAPSNYLARDLAWLGLPIQIIPNTIQISNYPYRERSTISPRLFWMRSFFWFYNPVMALHVAGRLLGIYPGLSLVMAGPDKGLLPETKHIADKLHICAKVSFPGFLDLESKVRLAGQNDIYLNTNTVDNMPVSVLEMAALGLPIVATSAGGLPDLLEHEKTALLVPAGDDQAMAAAVQRLLTEPNLTHRLSKNGRELAESYSWEQVFPQWEGLFSTIL
jgi:glycosyltransferase involved in cell wall biosynthesis